MDEDYLTSLDADQPPLSYAPAPDSSSLRADAYAGFPPHAGLPGPADILSLLMHLQVSARADTASSSIVHGAWTQQEDGLLTAAVAQLGSHKWTDVAKFVPTRTSKQCRERWFDRLAPGIRHEPFEPWEDAIIMDAQREIGNHWSRIAQRIPGRSPCAVKNRWYSGLRNQHPLQAQIDIGVGRAHSRCKPHKRLIA
jgi:hypothetical protein